MQRLHPGGEAAKSNLTPTTPQPRSQNRDNAPSKASTMSDGSHKHTLGLKCRLAPVPHAPGSDGLPAVEAQFFYSSLIPIDDPLSASSITTTDARSGKTPLRPFGRGDNNALEKAWLELQSEEDRRDHDNARKGRKQMPDTARESVEKRNLLVQSLALKHWDLHRSGLKPQDMSKPVETGTAPAAEPLCCAALTLDVSEELEKTFCALSRELNQSLKLEGVLQDVIGTINRVQYSGSKGDFDVNADKAEGTASKRLSTSDLPSSPPDPTRSSRSRTDGGHSVAIHARQPADFVKASVGRPRSGSQITNRSSRTQTPVGSPVPMRNFPVDDGITGKPFARVDGGGEPSTSTSAYVPRVDGATEVEPREDNTDHVEPIEELHNDALKMTEGVRAKKYGSEPVEIAVGVSRLHMVSLPTLQMKPIYWSPVNDVAVVMRATWFYRLVSRPI